MRKLKIDWSDLELAFDIGMNFDHRHYLDLETGEILLVSEEMLDKLEGAEEGDLDDYDKQLLVLKRTIEEEGGISERFVELPGQDSREGYRDMEDFIATVRSRSLRDRLERAIRGRGAFRAFRDNLADHPPVEKRWYAFRDQRLRERMMDWLEGLGVEPINPPPVREVPEPEEEEETDADRRAEMLEELTLLVLYLASWEEEVPPSGDTVHRAYKGHVFKVLDRLAAQGLITTSQRAKTLLLTEAGIARAQELEERYSSA